MVDLPQYPRRLAVSEAPSSAVSRADVESPYKALGTALDKLGEGLSEAAVPLAEQAGYKAVTRDADGNLQVERAPIIGKAGIAYARAVKVAALADGESVGKRDLLTMRQEFRNDPEGYASAAAAYKEKKVEQYSSTPAGPEVGLALGKVLENTSFEVYRGLQNEKENLDLRRAVTSIDAQIAAAENELTALARGGDTASPEFRERWDKIAALRREKSGNPRLSYPAEQVDYETKQLDGQVKAAGILYHVGQVERSQGFEAAVKVAEKILTDPKINLTSDQRQTIYNRALSEIRLRRQEQRIAEKEDATELADVGRLAVEGYPPTPERLAQLRQRAEGNPVFAENLRVTESTLTWVQSARQKAPADLDAELVSIEKEMRDKGVTPELASRYGAGTALLKNMRKEIASNPLGWADRTRVTAVPPIDFVAPDAAAQMRARIAKAESVGEYYRQPVQYLRPEERSALEAAASVGGPQMLKVAQIITQGFGDQAPKVLAEISQNAPVLAHLGGMLAAGLNGGQGSVIADAAENVRMRQDKDFKLPKFDTAKAIVAQENVENTTFGAAFVLAPSSGRAVQAVARDAFTTRMLRGTDKVEDALTLTGSSATKAYTRTLQEAAGARFPNGVQYGGVTQYGSRWLPGPDAGYVVVPGMVRADSFRDVITSIKDTDVPGVKASDIHNAIPVAAAGGYRFALGNPASSDPKWIPGPDGKPFVLDYARLEPELRKRVPSAFLGGR